MEINTEITATEATQAVGAPGTSGPAATGFTTDDNNLSFDDDGDNTGQTYQSESQAATVPAASAVSPADSNEDIYIPETQEQSAVADTPEAKVFEQIAQKFNIDGKIESVDQLVDALSSMKADTLLDADPRAIEISELLDAEDDYLVREVLSNNREAFNILSDSDIEDRIARYEDNKELENVANNIREKLEGELLTIKESLIGTAKESIMTPEQHVKEQQELTDSIVAVIDTMKEHPYISDKNLKAVLTDTKAFLLSGKYAEAVIGAETLKANPGQAVEAALWVNERTRNFMLKQMFAKAQEVGISNFIRDNLSGKTPSVGTGNVSVVNNKAYSLNDDNLEFE